MSKLWRIGLIAAVLCGAAVDVASAEQTLFRSDSSGVRIAYDNAEWEASELASYPYFACIAPDCFAATCLVVTSLSPDFAEWPATIDKASLDALDEIFLEYEKSGGHDNATIVQPTSAVTIGGREVLVNVIGAKRGETVYLSSKYMFRDAGDTRIVTCEGDEKSITASKGRIEALIGAIKFTPQ